VIWVAADNMPLLAMEFFVSSKTAAVAVAVLLLEPPFESVRAVVSGLG
jgi:hypothetical protein